MGVYLNHFKKVFPKNKIDQDTLLNWIIQHHQKAEVFKRGSTGLDPITIEKLFKRYGVKSSQISQRYLECSDSLTTDDQLNQIYTLNNQSPEGCTIRERAEFFLKRTDQIFNEIYFDPKINVKHPSHIIHTTCTGYLSPSSAQKIVVQPGWTGGSEVTHAYHMGCYAAMPSVRMAEGYLSAQRNLKKDHYSVDIVHTEMCGLHMDPTQHSPEQMVVQTLFADGHIKYSLNNKPSQDSLNLKLLSIVEKVIPDSELDMSWIPSSWGMQMNLSREVPAKIKAHLSDFNKLIQAEAGLTTNQFKNAQYAIHPGGPKIIDSICEALDLRPEQSLESREILFNRGNMSSATLPHVWDKILQNNYEKGTFVISYAFGPGLTMYGSVFEVC